MLCNRNVKTILFILFVTIYTSFAQEINYGLSVGYSRTTPIFDIEYNHENISSDNYFNLMAIVEISGNKISRVQSGFKYFKMGYSSDNYPIRNTTHFALPPIRSGSTLSYIALPLDINILLPFLSTVYISGGTEGAYLISAESFSEKSDGSYKEWGSRDQYREFIMLIMFGIGAEFQLENMTFFVEPEYSRSLMDITKVPNSLSSFTIEQFSINVGIKI